MKTLISSFDSSLTNYIQAWPSWLHPVMSSATYIGRPVFTISILIILGVHGLISNNYRLAIATISSGFLFGVNTIIKSYVSRERPVNDYTLAQAFGTNSFPSGHAASSVLVFGLLAYLLWNYLPSPLNYILPIALFLLIVLIGISRVYLGAHYPSDVVAGWVFGLVGLVLIIYTMRPSL